MNGAVHGARLAAVAVLALAMSVSTIGQTSAALDGLVAAERAFAAATAIVGVRDGFLAFFAPDAVAVEVRSDGSARLLSAHARIAAGPAASYPLSRVLTWAPLTGQVSGDQAMGWLTGPYGERTSDGAPGASGFYFSVWRRQADGTWKVWLDQGIAAPETSSSVDFSAAEDPGAAPAESADLAESAVSDGAAAWADRLSAHARLHRHGIAPRLGADAIRAWRADTWRSLHYHAVRTDVAATMAVSLGGYAGVQLDGRAEFGTFARVWQTDGEGRWRIVFETSRPAS